MSETNGDVIPQLKDEKDKTKLGIAVTVVGVIVGVTVAVAVGQIPYNNVVAQQAVPLFAVLAGAVVGFYFGKKSA